MPGQSFSPRFSECLDPPGGLAGPIVRAQLLKSFPHCPAAVSVEELAEAVLDAFVLRAIHRQRHPHARRISGARALVVGLAPHRDEQRRDGEPHHLVEGVVADGRHGSVEGRVVAAHGIGRAQVDDALGDVQQAGDR